MLEILKSQFGLLEYERGAFYSNILKILLKKQ